MPTTQTVTYDYEYPWEYVVEAYEKKFLLIGTPQTFSEDILEINYENFKVYILVYI